MSKFQYVILDKYDLVLEHYSGEIKAADLISAKQEMSNNPNYDFYMKTVIDFRDSVLNLDRLKDFESFASVLQDFFVPDRVRRVAYITNTPNETVLANLFGLGKKQRDLGLVTSICYSEESVDDWLHTNMPLAELKREIIRLRKNQ